MGVIRHNLSANHGAVFSWLGRSPVVQNGGDRHTSAPRPTRVPLAPAKASGAGTIFRLRGGGMGMGTQPTFAGVVHDTETPTVPPNIFFSSVLGHIFFTFDLFTDKSETKI